MHICEEIITVVKIAQNALFPGLHTNPLYWCYVDRDPLWSNKVRNNIGTAKHTFDGNEASMMTLLRYDYCRT